MKRIYLLSCLLLGIVAPLYSQLKPIEMADIHRWKKIEQPTVSTDGQWVVYTLAPNTEGDSEVLLWSAATGVSTRFARATEPKITEDGQYLIVRIKPALDSIKAMRRKKVKEADLPKDSILIFNCRTQEREVIPRVKTVVVPEKWNGYVFAHLEPELPQKEVKTATDSTAQKQDTLQKKEAPKKSAKPKKENKENGTRLLVRYLGQSRTDTLPFVQQFTLAEARAALLIATSGTLDAPQWVQKPLTVQPGVYWLDFKNKVPRPLWRGKYKYQQLSLSRSGDMAAFLLDRDTSAVRIRPWELALFQADSKLDSAQIIATPASNWLPIQPVEAFSQGKWGLSDASKPLFTEDQSTLYFGIAPPPILQDTTLLPEETVQVEVWAGSTPYLYTQLENRLDADKKRNWPAVYSIRTDEFVAFYQPTMEDLRITFQNKRKGDLALAFNSEPYAPATQWEGTAAKDVYAMDTKTGMLEPIVKNLRCKPSLSPDSRYIIWWSEPDTAWFAWQAKSKVTRRLQVPRSIPLFDETTDVPDFPDEYGLAGWLESDASVLLYDRYDLWKADPRGIEQAVRLTNGRAKQVTYRYIRLDPEVIPIASEGRILLHGFDHTKKTSHYAWLDMKGLKLSDCTEGAFSVTKSPIKAKKAETLVYTRENFETYPDLLYTPISNKDDLGKNMPLFTPRRISTANPQQSEYRWPTIEMVNWTSLQGDSLAGMLVKPANFDPKQQYPMIVNFYERQSDELYLHRPPVFARSQISATQYASRGYLVFIPDITYQIGYPGESAYDAILSGVTTLIQKGFVQPKRIGLQGHSWGGYQSAMLITRTNLFACAEAGAPVANMTSAYGGIRWESGMNRQFQYEKQQSRIGGTLWDKPLLYLENSPLFFLDKVQTPLLILHNDADGAVPWQQGIELFTGLRRLSKPVWMLNYNDEPHWPVKLQNRIDFQSRMQQYFDHYLLDKPAPDWMKKGVPPIEKGIRPLKF